MPCNAECKYRVTQEQAKKRGVFPPKGSGGFAISVMSSVDPTDAGCEAPRQEDFEWCTDKAATELTCDRSPDFVKPA